MSTRIAINEDNMRKYTTFFKDLYSHTHTTQPKSISIAEMVEKHNVGRTIIPAAIELRYLEKTGDRRSTKYRWIGSYPEPVEVRKILEHVKERNLPKVVTSFHPSPFEDVEEVAEEVKDATIRYRTLKDSDAYEFIIGERAKGYTQDYIGKNHFAMSGSSISKFLTNNRPAISTPMVKEEKPEKREFITPQPVPAEVIVKEPVAEIVEKKFREKKVKLLWGLYSYTEQVEV